MIRALLIAVIILLLSGCGLRPTISVTITPPIEQSEPVQLTPEAVKGKILWVLYFYITLGDGTRVVTPHTSFDQEKDCFEHRQVHRSMNAKYPNIEIDCVTEAQSI